ncbi:hypothetical protein [Methylovulum sp.]|uniref:hypothetical protein n=1 Tax=Methylovulum sp. TaxID=1916980 RepID=UPI0026019663|nr:hypothetical protein [Methylovulum sp.]MDD5125820.1 hypothetical protein [Methylovulum sp.]
MEEQETIDQVLQLSIEQWNKTFGGISALDICQKIGITNEEVMSIMESLCDEGKGTLNRNVDLYVITIDTENPKFEIPNTLTKTHIFFPSRKILTEHFYTSKLVREKHPEYKNRLHQGAHQLALVLFSDEVLTRYYDHPELYEIDDSLAGGHIWSKSEATENRYIYVRHGKRKLKTGKTAVTAIFKDLYEMSAEEQHHWQAYELEDAETAEGDPNFSRFLARAYEGAFVDYPSPLKDVTEALELINRDTSKGDLFKRTQNSHLRFPVENTQKALYDCCSELYKLIGPDSIDQKVIKRVLVESLGATESELIHAESQRPLSSMQLLTLIESKLGINSSLTNSIKSVCKYRIEADHKITPAAVDGNNHVEVFLFLCNELCESAKYFAHEIQNSKNT